MTEAVEAARRILAARVVLNKALLEDHPSFKEASRNLAYHELFAAQREGAELVARALLAAVERENGLREATQCLRKHLALFCGPDDEIANAIFRIADAVLASGQQGEKP